MVQPFAVVIESADALVAHTTVLGAAVLVRADVAQVTAAVLDDVPMLGPIEFGHDATPRAAALSQQDRVRRIDESRGQMEGGVQR